MSYIGTTKIGKMFLGDVEIAKAFLGTDLVFQKGGVVPPTPDPGDISNYVQDGLVMLLDGKQKGETEGRWENLAGAGYYTLNEHSTIEDDAIVLDGAGIISGTSIPAVGYTAGTIECVYENMGDASGVFVYAGTNGLCIVRSSTYIVFGVASSSNQWSVSNPSDSGTLSVNTNRLMINGAVVGTGKANNNWTSASAACPIGGRSTGSNRYYTHMRFKSIRKYNRLLTDAEMLQNARVDNARFNLGLNI